MADQKYSTTRFGDINSIPPRNGIYKKTEKLESGVRLIKMNELFSKRIINEDDYAEYINLSKTEEEKLLLKENDLLFSRTSVVADGVGKCSLVKIRNNKFTWDSNIIRIRIDEKKSDPTFYFYFFNSETGRQMVTSLASGAAVTTITGKNLIELKVPSPKISIQRKIASILSLHDELIEVNSKRIRILNNICAESYEKWIADLKEKNNTKEIKVGDIIELAYGKALPASIRIEGEYPVYGSSGIVGSHSSFLMRGPGIIVGRKGNVGSVFFSQKNYFPIDTVFYVVSKYSLYFLFFFLKNQQFVNNDAAVPGLNRNQVYQKNAHLPSEDDAEKFGQLIKPLFDQISYLTEINNTLENTKSILLSKLISGEINVENLDIKIRQEIL